MWSGPWQQWPLQQSMYQNVPHDQVDWAALAKQWIQLQHVHKSEVRPPNPMPGHPVMPLPVHEPMPIPPQMHPPAVVKIPLLSDPIIPPEPPRIDTVSHVESKVQHESYLPPDTKESNFWPGRWDDDAKVVSNDSWPQPPPPAEDSYDFGHMHGNQHLQAQSYDYNHGSDHYGYNQDFSSDVDYSQYWIDQSSTELPPFVRQEKKQRSSDAPLLHSEQDSIQAGQLDAAKRKTLPAWIREGLEKMERQKQKKMESSKQTVGKPPAPPLEEELTGDAISRAKIFIDAEKSRFESESEGEDEARKESNRELSPAIEKYSAPSPITENLTDEERRQEVMLRVRRLLTEILLGVTNEEISAVAKEVYQRALSKGGLADYGSEEESDEGESDSDYELDQKIREKQKAFAVREREIVAMLDQEEAAEKLRLKGKQDVASSEPNVKKLASESIPEPSSNRPNMESTEKPAAEDIKIEPAEKPTNQDSKESIPQVAAGSKSRDTSTSKSPDSDSSSSSSSSTSSSSLGKRKKKSGGGTKRKPRESRKRKRSSSRESDRGSSRKSYRGKRSRSRDTGSRKVRRRSPDRSSRRRRSRSAEKHRHGASSSRKRSRSRSPDRSKRHRSRSRDRDSKYKSRSKAKPRSRSKSPKRSRTNRERSHSPKSKKRQSRSSSSESERSDRKKSGGKK